ncbi:MAG: NADP-reducing hydrogenase subunit HndC [Syntrophomonadaceae bacterium]|nr:NADP-reducing hydrogenase subunit HndC [Bacillota bacterium]
MGTPIEALKRMKPDLQKIKICVTVCGGTGCYVSGGQEIAEAFKKNIKEMGLDLRVVVRLTGCQGLCERGPLIVIYPDRILYQKAKVEDVEEIISETLLKRKVIDRLVSVHPTTGEKIFCLDEVPFYKKQLRITRRHCGTIDPESIEDYLVVRGYEALAKVLAECSPEGVVEEVVKSGLRGRGGGGFPTGVKWKYVAAEKNNEKYVICNADEGGPGVFMDRSTLEGDPHTVIEGMIIGAYAVGANKGFIYIRAESPLAVKRLKKAIKDALRFGFLGEKILGTEFSFNIEIILGAGAFVCGEETALIHSIEGCRGMPRAKPPYPSVKGLWGKPTLINNVETFTNITVIILDGYKYFASIGTEKSRGTKVFALAGKINNTGLIEVPMGITLREVIYDIGGGIKGGKKFKAVLTGGPSGGCLSEQHLDIIVDYDFLKAAGSMMGSGGMVVLDEDDCMVDSARYFLEFTQNESCGKCTPCREGTKRMLEILTRITSGKGKEEDIEKLERLADMIKKASLCGLGQTAPNPVLTTLRYFRNEYEAHVKHKRCLAGVCRALIKYTINSEKCIGCGVCLKSCPISAISGQKKEPYSIDQNKCTQCGRCYSTCKFEAITKE